MRKRRAKEGGERGRGGIEGGRRERRRREIERRQSLHTVTVQGT
jgi:hypothetical protein